MPDDNELDELDVEFDFDDEVDRLEQTGESLFAEAALKKSRSVNDPKRDNAPSTGAESVAKLQGLFNRVEVHEVLESWKSLLRGGTAAHKVGAIAADNTDGDRLPAAGEAYFRGQRADLFGFDPSGRGAIIGQALRSKHELQSLISLSHIDDARAVSGEGDVFSRVKIGAVDLWLNDQGRVFRTEMQLNGEIALRKTNMKLVPASSPELATITSTAPEQSIAREAGRDEIGSILPADDGFLELTAVPSMEPRSRALAQSNDYASTGRLSDTLEDGFRTAGRNRLFDGSGNFNASDRAAIVVDRLTDVKLRQLLDELRDYDSKLKTEGASQQQRAEALARRVRTVMNPAGKTEEELDQAYRAFMKANAGNTVPLGELIGSGSCAPASLILKLAADQLGFNCTLHRGNNGTHVWTTFGGADGERKIFDVKAEVYGVDESLSKFHVPDGLSIPCAEYSTGQAVSYDGKEWIVRETDALTGALKLDRITETSVSAEDVVKHNPGKQLRIGETFQLQRSATDGTATGERGWTLQAVREDGKLVFSKTEQISVKLKDQTAVNSPLELAAGPDLTYLKTNWATLVENNKLLSDGQRTELRVARDNLATASTAKQKEFRRLIDEIANLERTNPARANERAGAVAKIAEIAGKFPDRIHVPVDNVLKATDVDALKQVAETLSQSAPHLEKPAKAGTVDPSLRDAEGMRKAVDLDGKAFEYQSSQAIQKALQNKVLLAEMISKGRFPAGNWMYVPSAPGSALDHMNCDGMLVDLDSGRALFFDFAMPSKGHDGRPHGAYRLKVGTVDKHGRPKSAEPWAFSVERDVLGFEAKTDGYTGDVKAELLLEQIAAYHDGKLPERLIGKGTPVTQPAPDLINVKKLKTQLGEFPSARPVNSDVEAAVLSREEKKPVRSTQKEMADTERALRKVSSPTKAEATMLDGIQSAKSHVSEVNKLGGLFADGVRAAVEADRFGVSERAYGGQTHPNPDIRAGGPDVSEKCPKPYKGVPYIEMKGGNLKPTPASLSASQVRIYPNGDVVLVPQWSTDTYIPIGKIQDLGDLALKALVEAGYDPADFRDAAKKFRKTNFAELQEDLAKRAADTMTEADFWKKYPELKMLADAVHYGAEQAQAAKDHRPIFEARNEIDNHGDLSLLKEAEKQALAEKTAKLRKSDRTISVEDAKAILEIEKAGGLSEADATKARKFQQQVDPAESWTPKDAATKYQQAEQARAKDYPSRTTVEAHQIEELRTRLGVTAPAANDCFELRQKMGNSTPDTDLKSAAELFQRMRQKYKGKGCAPPTAETVAELYGKHKAITDVEIAEMAKIARKHPGQGLADIATVAKRNLEMEGIRPLIERAQKLWSDMDAGALPKNVNKEFAYIMEEALKEMKAEGLDPTTQRHYEDVVKRYKAEANATTPATTDALPKDIHDFFESPRKTGAVGDRVWQVPGNLSASEQDLFGRRLARYGENPLAKKAEFSKFAAAIDAQTAKWTEDLQPLAKRASDLNGKVQDAHRAAYEQALKEAGSPAEAAKLLQSGNGSDALKELRKQWKEVVDQHATCTEELARECKIRADVLQKAVNDFAASHGLPPIQIRVLEHLNGAGGHYVRGQGDFRVTTADLLNPGAGAELAGVLYHELVHLQQDNLVFKKVMDDLKITELSSEPAKRAEQLKQIRERYNAETGAKLPELGDKEKNRWETFVEDVAKERKGKPLDSTERGKAEALAKSFKEGSPLGVRFQQTADAVRILEIESRRLGDRPGNRVAEDLVARLAAQGSEAELLRKQFFGDKESGALYDLVEQYRKAAKDSSGRAKIWDEAGARKIVGDHIDGEGGKGGRIDSLNTERRKLYRDYMRPLYEQEATLLGNKVHSMETRQVLRASYDRTNGSGGGEPAKPTTESKPGQENPKEPKKPGADESLNEIPVNEKDRRPTDPLAARDKPLDLKTLEGPNGLKILADRLAEPKLMEKLKEYDNDAKFREIFEKKIKDAKGEDKEKLEKEYEKYKKLGSAEQELVRRSVIAEAVDAHIAKQRGREWVRSTERVLGAAGTFIAVFMLAELILSECKTGSSSSDKPANPSIK